MNTSRPGYSDEFVRRRDAEQADAARQAEADAAENERLGARRLAALAAKRAADEAANDARLEASLEPERTKLQRQWLADHPDHSAEDFRSKAWPRLRANLGDQRAAELHEEQKAALARSGAYGL